MAHNYQVQGKKVLLLKPGIDTRFGLETITSRAGIEKKADIIITKETNLLLDIPEVMRKVHCILVDEVQFLEPSHIDQLRSMTLLWNVPVVRTVYTIFVYLKAIYVQCTYISPVNRYVMVSGQIFALICSPEVGGFSNSRTILKRSRRLVISVIGKRYLI